MGSACKEPACILAIGTANPDHCVLQSDFPDFYFGNIAGSHSQETVDKLRRICEKSKIRKRHLYISQEVLRRHPSLAAYGGPSYNDRQAILAEALPEQAVAAAKKALSEWGRPVSDITHFVFCTTAGGDMPGLDFDVAARLGLSAGIQRFPLYHQGCHGGGFMLRVAKDLAENNPGARVLCIASESTVATFRGQPEDPHSHLDNLVSQALFADGASCIIIGTAPAISGERPLFQILASLQSFTPGTADGILGFSREHGLMLHLKENIPTVVSQFIEECLRDAYAKAGCGGPPEFNNMFWAVHPGGPAILDGIESALALTPDKLRASRDVLAEYGNVVGACVLFVLDDIRRKSVEEKMSTTGEGHGVGFLIGLGPGITAEISVLRAMAVEV